MNINVNQNPFELGKAAGADAALIETATRGGLALWCKRVVVQIARYPISLTLVILLFGTSFLYAQEVEFEKPCVVEV